MKLLRTLILRPLTRDRLRTVLTILAVALGVAVVIAIWAYLPPCSAWRSVSLFRCC